MICRQPFRELSQTPRELFSQKRNKTHTCLLTVASSLGRPPRCVDETRAPHSSARRTAICCFVYFTRDCQPSTWGRESAAPSSRLQDTDGPNIVCGSECVKGLLSCQSAEMDDTWQVGSTELAWHQGCEQKELALGAWALGTFLLLQTFPVSLPAENSPDNHGIYSVRLGAETAPIATWGPEPGGRETDSCINSMPAFRTPFHRSLSSVVQGLQTLVLFLTSLPSINTNIFIF